MTQQLVPEGEWSSPGWAVVPSGAAFSQRPVVASSLGSPAVQPAGTSQSSLMASVNVPTTAV